MEADKEFQNKLKIPLKGFTNSIQSYVLLSSDVILSVSILFVSVESYGAHKTVTLVKTLHYWI